MRKLAVFVDVQNIYYTTRQAFGRHFNYQALWEDLKQQGEVVTAIAYAIEPQDNPQHKFQRALHHLGFKVKLKPYIQRRDGSSKGDWDVGITIDIMELAGDVDTVVLLSGDGDFAMLMEKIKSKHQVHTQVYGVEQLTAGGLIKSCDTFHPIDEPLLK